MKDSIFQVPLTGDFIDLEHLLHVGTTERGRYGVVGIRLTYMLQKEKVDVFLNQDILFSKEELEKYNKRKGDHPMSSEAPDELTREYRTISMQRFEEGVRVPIFNAWKAYRESKIK